MQIPSKNPTTPQIYIKPIINLLTELLTAIITTDDLKVQMTNTIKSLLHILTYPLSMNNLEIVH